MKITAQEEYGLRCMVAVARLQKDNRPVTIGEIAAAEGISHQYAAKLLNLLRKKELIESLRGIAGGFRIARVAVDITVAEILRALGSGFEVGLQPHCSSYSGKLDTCAHFPKCSLRPLWDTITKHVNDFLRNLSLQDLLEEEDVAKSRMQQHMKSIIEKHSDKEQPDDQACNA